MVSSNILGNVTPHLKHIIIIIINCSSSCISITVCTSCLREERKNVNVMLIFLSLFDENDKHSSVDKKLKKPQ